MSGRPRAGDMDWSNHRATVKAAVVRSFDRPLEDVNHAVDQVLDEARPSHGWCSR